MDVERGGHTIQRGRRQGPSHERERQMTQVRAAGGRKPHTGDGQRRQRKLHQRSIFARDGVRYGRRVGISVSAATNRKEARIVYVAFRDERVERPFASVQDREARRPISQDRRSRQILENALRRSYVVAERRSRER